jgi:hypothetical protein
LQSLRNLVIYGRSFSLFSILFGTALVFSSNICADNNIASYAQPLTPALPSATTGLPTIQITSPQDGQQVPPGELTIQGISSDDEETDCQVYADINDITPMRNVTAAGDSGEEEDFSKWIFTYTQEYQFIKQGENELTAKISCHDNGVSTGTTPPGSPLSEWHTVNVTGVAGAAANPLPSPSLSGTEEIDEPNEESANEEEEESEEESGSDTDGSDSDSGDDDSNDGLFGGDSFFN